MTNDLNVFFKKDGIEIVKYNKISYQILLEK